MSGRIAEILDQIEAQQEPPLPKGVRALELLQMTYRGEVKPSAQQMRAAIESLPYENPRVSAVALGYLSREDFASALDRAIDRSNGVKLIESHVIEVDDGSR